MEPLEKLFRDEIADLYDAEQQILKALPKMIEAVSAPQLRNALEQHRKATEGQVKRLEEIFQVEGKPSQKKCKGMAGLIAEGDELLKEDYEGDVLDAAIIGAAQRVEHYEIAAYGTARAFAEHLGKNEAVELLQETLDEEKEADELLTQIAESQVNLRASEEEGEAGDSDDSEDSEGETEEREDRAMAKSSSGRGNSSGRSMSASSKSSGRSGSGNSGNSSRGSNSSKSRTKSSRSRSRSKSTSNR
jgi:ferritin-like metal-binding protein YciE